MNHLPVIGTSVGDGTIPDRPTSAIFVGTVNSTYRSGITSQYSTIVSFLLSVQPTAADPAISSGSTMEYVTSEDSDLTSTSKQVSLHVAALLFVTFTIGILGNSLYLWVLSCKMIQTASTICFYHLIWAYLLFTLIIPFYATFLLKDEDWIFGLTLCKLVTFVLSLSMYSSVFLLTTISVDRCLLVIYPLWTRSYRKTKWASVVCFSIWVLALVFSLPYLAFPKTSVDVNNKTSCFNDYTFSDDSITPEVQRLQRTVHLSMFIIRLMMGFLIPFSIMTACYMKLAMTLKAGNHNKTNKPFKVIATTVISFFVCWLPYHIYSGLIIYQESLPQLVILIVRGLSIILCCINAGCTPMLYLFIGETFRELFKISLHSLFKRIFDEDLIRHSQDSKTKPFESETSSQSPVTSLF